MFKQLSARWVIPVVAFGLFFGLALASCSEGGTAGMDVSEVARERHLSEQDVLAAVKTYQPTGRFDPYVLFASGGHSGQVLVIGVPSMRLLKVIAVFTPEPWQGYGVGAVETQDVLDEGRMADHDLTWGDTHHPALSESEGDYDGQYLFINDKANPRIAVIDLRDFETKQIVTDPNMGTNHGGTFVTPNTEYVIEAAQYSIPLWEEYADVDRYEESYRGLVTFWKFDRASGRIDHDASFSMELPPYWHDLSDAGKGPSFGWAFVNSFNTEMATGGFEDGNPPFEAGASANDMDYMHIINWQKAARVAGEAGKTRMSRGMRVIPLAVSIEEGLLYLTPEPKSPHGVDVTPDGTRMVVSGKLDPHATIYSWEKIRSAIDSGGSGETDSYGIPILPFDDVLEAQVELGLGPLHTQFDDKGNAYTSIFLESKVAKWRLDPPELLEKIDVHYNVGHLAMAEGDTRTPDGKYLIAMDKWSIDRFQPVGPLLPQNFQLIDVDESPMQLLYDMPIGIGEPHYAQMIKADKLEPFQVYPGVGYSPHLMALKEGAPVSGTERIERVGNTVHVYMTAMRSHFKPEYIRVNQGDEVVLHVTNIEQAHDATHGLGISKYNVNVSIEPGETQEIRFTADQAGVFPFYCTEFCSALHLEMAGYLLVKPAG
ncbi:MAG: Sec-dependent nitrous-oxide reductase [Candidatus Palauibacterales bacterium]|nr:Sec-dependent nitrous-oxide reductase [Candidatus Palauibacterales bacterium]MDP2482053.1 Sec-dependent nitrous-oxide reductase [Candidatus Palauibacterales bacterium]